jgi:predicted transcriptional regulator
MILISLYPEHLETIKQGKKKYEFRKSTFKGIKNEKYIAIFETKPESRICGVMVVGKVTVGKPEFLWDNFGEMSGITKKYFFDYYQNKGNFKKEGIAIEIKKYLPLKKPLTIREIRKIYRDFVPPQNFYKFSEESYGKLMNIIKKELKIT